MGKTYAVSEEFLLLVMQRLRELNTVVVGVDKWVEDIEREMSKQDNNRPYMRPGLQEVKDILDEMFNVMNAKGHDYSGSQHTFTSFERSAHFAGVDPSVAFNILIGVKISRLTSLRDRDPFNEAVLDSYIDMANYLVLFLAYQKFREKTT